MRHRIIHNTLIISAVIAAVTMIGFSPFAVAHEGKDHTKTTNETPTITKESPEKTSMERQGGAVTERRDMITMNREGRQEIQREKLDDRKRQICQTNETNITSAIDNVTKRSDRHLKNITRIYDLTTGYYEREGLTVTGYDQLITDINADKAAAEAAFESLSGEPKFSCGSDGPKATVQSFQNKRLDKIEAFTDYRQSVKSLIQAVKQAAQTKEGSNE